MKTILVPFDFSKSSESAFDYAVEFASYQKAKLILLHITNPDFKLDAEKNNQIETRLNKLCLNAGYRSGSESSFILKTGKVAEIISETAVEKKAALIIMGTASYKSFTDILSGSHAEKTVLSATIPVLVIPEGREFKAFKMITYATDYKDGDFAILRHLVELAEPFRAQINLLHISPESMDPETERQQMKTFKEAVTTEINYNNLSFQIMSAANLTEFLKDYTTSGAADLLVLSTTHKPGWQNLFNESITAGMVTNATIPLLAFHRNKNASVKLFI